MTDTLHKNPESSTVSDTPETNQCVKNNKHLRFLEEDHCSINGKFTFTNPVVNLCKKLERERNELIDALSSVLVDTTSTYGYLESHIDAEQTLKQILSTR